KNQAAPPPAPLPGKAQASGVFAAHARGQARRDAQETVSARLDDPRRLALRRGLSRGGDLSTWVGLAQQLVQVTGNAPHPAPTVLGLGLGVIVGVGIDVVGIGATQRVLDELVPGDAKVVGSTNA